MSNTTVDYIVLTTEPKESPSAQNNTGNANSIELAPNNIVPYEAIPASVNPTIDRLNTSLKDNMDKFVVTVRPLVSFIIGAIIGAVCMKEGSFWSFVIPLSIILVFVFELALATWATGAASPAP